MPSSSSRQQQPTATSSTSTSEGILDAYNLPTPYSTTELGSMTDVFAATITPASSCDEWHLVSSSTDSKRTALTFQADLDENSNCLPTPYMDALKNHQAPVLTAGAACPTGMEPKCTMVARGAASAGLAAWDVLKKDQTAIGCCKHGFVCDPAASHRYLCIAEATQGQVVTASSSKYTVGDGVVATAYAMQVIYVQANLAIYTQSPAPTPVGTGYMYAPSSDASSSSSSSSALSPGAKAGVGIGAAAGFFLLMLGGYLIYRSRRRRFRKDWERSVANSTAQGSYRTAMASSTTIAKKVSVVPVGGDDSHWKVNAVELPAAVPESWKDKALPEMPEIPEMPDSKSEYV